MTTSGHNSDQGGEHGGAMDKLKSVWREAIGSRDDETRADARPDTTDGRGRQATPGGAQPADVRPEVTARNASGMQPPDDGAGPVTQQLPHHGGQPQRGPQQPGQAPVPQQAAPARQDQTVAAGSRAPAAQGGPTWGGQDRPDAAGAQQQVPRQAAPPQGSAQAAAPPQSAPPSAEQAAPQQAAPQQAAPQQAAPRQSAPQQSQAGAPAGDPDATQQSPVASGPAAQQQTQQAAGARPEAADRSGQSVWSEPDRNGAGDGRRDGEKHIDRAGEAPTRPTDSGERAGAATDNPRGRHELFDADRGSGSSGTGAATGAAVGAGVAGAAAGGAATAGDRTDHGSADHDSARAGGVATDRRDAARPDADADGAVDDGDRATAAAGSAAPTSAAPAGAAPTGAAGAGTGAAGEGVPADPDRFIPVERSQGYAARWSEVKGDFVDEPRDAVRRADALVGEVLDEIARVFSEQRSQLEHGLDTDGTSTEDLRQAMHRYRQFFERLLKI